MKIFFGSIFVKKEILKEAGRIYPIKLEYYKIINEDEIIKNRRAKFGIEILKTEYAEKSTKIERKVINYISNDERKIEEILNIFKNNSVTPISASEIVLDLCKAFVTSYN